MKKPHNRGFSRFKVLIEKIRFDAAGKNRFNMFELISFNSYLSVLFFTRQV